MAFDNDVQQELFAPQNTKNIKDLIEDDEEIKDLEGTYITLNEYGRFFNSNARGGI